jgi:hypothetical protein
VSVTVSVYSTLVVAAWKTQKRPLTPQPSSTFTISSQLSGLKNQNSAEPSVAGGATQPGPLRPMKSLQVTSASKRPRWSATRVTSGALWQVPLPLSVKPLPAAGRSSQS